MSAARAAVPGGERAGSATSVSPRSSTESAVMRPVVTSSFSRVKAVAFCAAKMPPAAMAEAMLATTSAALHLGSKS
jgi:hypothetical protein